MWRPFGKWFTSPKRWPPPSPDAPFYAIGDIHGHHDKLSAALHLIDAKAEPDAPIIWLGDFIDRGPHSRRTLVTLCAEQELRGRDRFVCLKGNHEQMLLDALDAPRIKAPGWLRAGGLETVRDMGLTYPKPGAAEAEWQAFSAKLHCELGARSVAWLRSLPLWWSSGNVLAVHAGADPGVPATEQTDQSCLWGHPDFLKRDRTDGQWVVHGHTIVDRPETTRSRIAIDTGAYATDRLTVARIGDGAVTFFEV